MTNVVIKNHFKLLTFSSREFLQKFETGKVRYQRLERLQMLIVLRWRPINVLRFSR